MINLKDIITFTLDETGDISLDLNHPDIPSDNKNLVVKAAQALKLRAGVYQGARIKLEKSIPVAAGLGGGSSNAAATLLALNKLWKTRMPREVLSEIGATIGADIPFFIGTSPMAWVEGIGERVYPLRPVKKLPLLLANPGFGISAAQAYKNSSFDFADFPRDQAVVDDLASGDPSRAAGRMENDLERWALDNFENLARLKKKMEYTSPRPLRVMMSGSGPTLLAVYEDESARNDAAEALREAAPFVSPVETLSSLENG